MTGGFHCSTMAIWGVDGGGGREPGWYVYATEVHFSGSLSAGRLGRAVPSGDFASSPYPISYVIRESSGAPQSLGKTKTYGRARTEASQDFIKQSRIVLLKGGILWVLLCYPGTVFSTLFFIAGASPTFLTCPCANRPSSCAGSRWLLPAHASFMKE